MKPSTQFCNLKTPLWISLLPFLLAGCPSGSQISTPAPDNGEQIVKIERVFVESQGTERASVDPALHLKVQRRYRLGIHTQSLFRKPDEALFSPAPQIRRSLTVEAIVHTQDGRLIATSSASLELLGEDGTTDLLFSVPIELAPLLTLRNTLWLSLNDSGASAPIGIVEIPFFADQPIPITIPMGSGDTRAMRLSKLKPPKEFSPQSTSFSTTAAFHSYYGLKPLTSERLRLYSVPEHLIQSVAKAESIAPQDLHWLCSLYFLPLDEQSSACRAQPKAFLEVGRSRHVEAVDGEPAILATDSLDLRVEAALFQDRMISAEQIEGTRHGVKTFTTVSSGIEAYGDVYGGAEAGVKFFGTGATVGTKAGVKGSFGRDVGRSDDHETYVLKQTNIRDAIRSRLSAFRFKVLTTEQLTLGFQARVRHCLTIRLKERPDRKSFISCAPETQLEPVKEDWFIITEKVSTSGILRDRGTLAGQGLAKVVRGKRQFAHLQSLLENNTLTFALQPMTHLSDPSHVASALTPTSTLAESEAFSGGAFIGVLDSEPLK